MDHQGSPQSFYWGLITHYPWGFLIFESPSRGRTGISWSKAPIISLTIWLSCGQGFPDGSMVKESTCSAGDTGDTGSIPGWERSLGEGNGIHCGILAWKIPLTEEPGGLHSKGWHKEFDMTEQLNAHTHTHTHTHILWSMSQSKQRCSNQT